MVLMDVHYYVNGEFDHVYHFHLPDIEYGRREGGREGGGTTYDTQMHNKYYDTHIHVDTNVFSVV